MTWYLKYKLQLNINFEIVYNNNWIIVKIKALLSFKKKNSFQFVSKEELLFERALFEFYRPIFEIIPFALRFRHTLATTIMNYSGSLRIGAQFPAKTLANLSSPATTTLGIPCSLLGKCDAFCIWMPATWNYPAVSFLSFFLFLQHLSRSGKLRETRGSFLSWLPGGADGVYVGKIQEMWRNFV